MDVFLICPTVDTRSATNSFDLNEKLKSNFVNALGMERGIYEETGRLFSPYYQQMSINAYRLPEAEREQAKEIAYADIRAAFRWYLDHENEGRGIILAGFSQGGEMCLELLKEFYGGESEEASALRDRLIAVYSIGWSVTEEMTEAYPQIIPAYGETDVGTVVSFDCSQRILKSTISPFSPTTSSLQKIVGQPSFFIRGPANWEKVSLIMITCVMLRSSLRKSSAPGSGSILAIVS